MNEKCTVAKFLYSANVMRHVQDRLSTCPELPDPLKALLLKRAVPDRQNFIDQQDVRIDFCSHSKRQAHVHSRRVLLNRGIDKITEFGKFYNALLSFLDISFGQPEQQPVKQN